MVEKILVVDDQPAAVRALANELEDAGFDVIVAADGREAFARFREAAPAAVVTDLVMPRSDGIDLLGRIRAESDVPVILFSAHGSIETAVAALKAGADDFVSTDDFDTGRLVKMVRDALNPANRRTRQGFSQRLVGSSASMQAVQERLEGLAPLDVPVLLVGGPGVGASTAARALHELGSTAGSSFRRIDAESFTPNAAVDSLGAIHLHGVEGLAPESQAFWLERLRVPSVSESQVRPRLIGSSREPLEPLTECGAFDPDLAEALSRFEIRLPGLAERTEDLPELSIALLERAAQTLGRRRARISPAAMTRLAELPWPGNVAELERVLERSLAYSRGREISRRAIEDVVADLAENLATLRATRERLERDALVLALRETGGNITRAAESLGKSRSSVYRLIDKHGIRLTRNI